MKVPGHAWKWIYQSWGLKYGVRLCLMVWSSHSNSAHHSCSPLISSKFLLILMLESKGSFLKFGHRTTFITLKEGKSKLHSHILLSFGRLRKLTRTSLENRPKSDSISETPHSPTCITSSKEVQSRMFSNLRFEA